MAKAKLTKREADSATAPFTWDTELRGFGLRVTPSGRKSWVVQYLAERRTRRLTLGHYPGLTPAQARKQAEIQLARIHSGADPAQEKSDRIAAPTIEDLAERYRGEHSAKNKPRTRAENERLLEREILPTFRTRHVSEVTTSDVSRWHASYSTRPILGNRAMFLLSTLFGLAERWAWREAGTNPTRFVDRFPEQARERHLDDLELRKLGKALAGVEQSPEHSSDPLKVAAVRLLLFTGCRRGEILGLRWEQVLLDRGLLMLADTKTGSRAIVLNGPAVEVFRGLEEHRPGCSWVFPNPARTGPLGEFRKVWNRILEKAEIKNLRLHDLRHTFASQGLIENLSLPAIGSLLGHSRPATTQRYAHWQSATLREQSDRVGKRLHEALGEDK